MSKLEDYLIRNGFNKDVHFSQYEPIDGERYSNRSRYYSVTYKKKVKGKIFEVAIRVWD